MSVTVRFIGDGQTTVTDINSNSVVLRRGNTATLADATWAGYTAQYQSLFEQIGSPAGSGATSYSIIIGDNTTKVFTVAHNLNKTALTWSVQDVGTGEYVLPTTVQISANAIQITFGVAPTTGQYKVTVIA